MDHLLFFGLGAAFFLGLTQLCGKTREFEGRTTLFLWAAFLGIAVMILSFYPLTRLVGLEGAALATLSGFLVYFLVIAIVARTWPRMAGIFVGVLACGVLLLARHALIQGLGSILGWVLTGVLLLVYSLAVVWWAKGRLA